MDRTFTESLCPSCLTRLKARRIWQDQDVYLEKICPDHGPFRTRIWKGEPLFRVWRLPKIPFQPPVLFKKTEKGCPYDCGLCPDHRQQSCTVILEVTSRCDLGCTVCYADSQKKGVDPALETITGWFKQVKEAVGRCNIQLSGGEPTLRDDLPEIVAEGRRLGFGFIQLNTNGLRLAKDRDYLQALKKAGLSSLFLQFDGTDDSIYQCLRGRPLLKEKQEAIAACGENDIGVVLVPTLVPGLNVDNIRSILETALGLSPVVRGVHFQPISYFGRFKGQPADDRRLTLPELMSAIETQSQGLFKKEHLRPPGCENALCSFHGHFLVKKDGTIQPLQKAWEPEKNQPDLKANDGADRAITYVARQWAGTVQPSSEAGNLRNDGSDQDEQASPTCCSPQGLMSLDDFIDLAREHLFSLSAMAFQDVWNITLDRVRDCCIHVFSPKGFLVPFCLYNLTSLDGRSLYRSR